MKSFLDWMLELRESYKGLAGPSSQEAAEDAFLKGLEGSSKGILEKASEYIRERPDIAEAEFYCNRTAIDGETGDTLQAVGTRAGGESYKLGQESESLLIFLSTLADNYARIEGGLNTNEDNYAVEMELNGVRYLLMNGNLPKLHEESRKSYLVGLYELEGRSKTLEYLSEFFGGAKRAFMPIKKGSSGKMSGDEMSEDSLTQYAAGFLNYLGSADLKIGKYTFSLGNEGFEAYKAK